MQKPSRTTLYNLGAETTLDKLRELVEQTKSVNGSARISFSESLGQRDQVYNMIQITERDW